MLIFYNIIIFLTDAAIRLARPFHPKAKAFISGRKGLLNHIALTLEGNSRPVIWVHAASLGEFEQGRPVMEAIRKEFPFYRILLTFYSPSGYEVRRNYSGADYIFYLPMDYPKQAEAFVKLVNPVLAIFVKYEFWYHYAKTLKHNNVPLISISAIFRQDQFFFSRFGESYRKILRQFDFFFVQNEESIALLKSIGIHNCVLTGDTRFDRVNQIQMTQETLPVIEVFKSGQKVLVAGSVWQEDIEVLLPLINESKLKFIVAPHEISEKFINALESSLSVRSVRYSQAANQPLSDVMVLIIDNIGMLSKLYRYGEFAFIGGAFGKGLHNILEAACYGIPVMFGDKNYEKFQEAVDLINRGGAFSVSDSRTLKEKFELLNVPESFLLACSVTREYVEENLGATEKIMRYCRKILSVNQGPTIL